MSEKILPEKKPDRAIEHKIIIGLVGTSGSGKNEAAKFFTAADTLVIDADTIAHEVLHENEKTILAVFKKYTTKIENENGSLNKAELAKLLFSDPQLLKQHEAIIFPRIEEKIIALITASTKKIIVLNAPTLHKSKLMRVVHCFIYVTANYFLRMRRVQKRDTLSLREVFLRFKNQKNFLHEYQATGKKIYIIHNNFSKKYLGEKIKKILKNLSR